MKKRSRCQRSSEALQQSSKPPAPVSVTVNKRQFGNKQRPVICHNNAANCSGTSTQRCSENKTKSAGRLSTAVCRLCHGKFSPRSLRHAFNKLPQESGTVVDGESDAAAQSPLLFHSDFQRLVGVQLDRDPRLSDFVCKKCHTKFYKCHSILIRFRQRVNLPPVGKENSRDRKSAACEESSVNSGSTNPKCLHSLVSWAHQHGEACRSCPDLKEVLEGQCWGSVRAVWCCVDGHSYTMDTRCSAAADMTSSGAGAGGNGAAGMSEEEERAEEEGDQELLTPVAQHSPSAATPQAQHSLLADWTIDTDDFAGPEEVQLEETPADSDLSDRIDSEDEESRKATLSDDELFEPYSHKRARRVAVANKRRPNPKDPEEPKLKKKPGPKPGWKTKFKPKGEDLPNIYKCPYSGCTAVYRAPDGLKKHIKEHHEEVRERPCPHPGCNKVFMIDRYLQRHIKLIHTEERNYICDQCGQTFKQRKHLSVHQMRHSGAKPLQCEVCGFQCRQRASLKYHMTKHKAEADLEFACLMCGKRFEKAHNLNVHMSMVHPLVQAKVQQQQPPTSPTAPLPPQPPYANLHTISLSGEVVQQEHDR